MDEILSNLRLKESGGVTNTTQDFPPQINFRNVRHVIEQSEVYTIFKSMPKGNNKDRSLVINYNPYQAESYMYMPSTTPGLSLRMLLTEMIFI